MDNERITKEEFRKQVARAFSGPRPRWYRPFARQRWLVMYTYLSTLELSSEDTPSMREIEETFFDEQIRPYMQTTLERLNDAYGFPEGFGTVR